MQVATQGGQRDVDDRGVENRHHRAQQHHGSQAPHPGVDPVAYVVYRAQSSEILRFRIIRLRTISRPSYLRFMSRFTELGLEPELLEAIRDVGYELPSPIQEQAIPPLLEGRDVIGQAQTGSGKTAAFGLPMLQYVDPSEPDVQGLVLTPTRELCIQVTQALRAYGQRRGVDVVAVFGGAPIRSQQAQLRAGGQVVVGTVGRVKDLISRHTLLLPGCRFVVLDEADEMLDLGFLEDVERIA